ncbi:hypothetical protein TNCV_544471 [Trichonephila clavipes]|nr:hypothetical protein TNCV_544471 [Trichonephila clavipes]
MFTFEQAYGIHLTELGQDDSISDNHADRGEQKASVDDEHSPASDFGIPREFSDSYHDGGRIRRGERALLYCLKDSVVRLRESLVYASHQDA